MRVALRRLRSLLATFRPMFDADVVGSLRDEVKWVAGERGAARDREVVRERLSRLATGPEKRSVADRIERELGAAEFAGVERTLEALDSEREPTTPARPEQPGVRPTVDSGRGTVVS